MTIARKYEDYRSSRDFPVSNGVPGSVNYNEDIFVGIEDLMPTPSLRLILLAIVSAIRSLIIPT